MLSIFTPTNDPRYLPEAYDSLLKQTDPDWQWTILANQGAEVPVFSDPRVTMRAVDSAPAVGKVKALAVEQAPGDLLLELDHDDLLLPDAVRKVKDAFADQDVGFVYSNTLRASADLKPAKRFGDGYGWSYRQHVFRGETLDEPLTPEISPASLSRIWYCPDHVRAFRRSAYEAAGGYSNRTVLDDQDLMCRLYTKTNFAHIDAPLYVYRIHGENAWLKHNAAIQSGTLELHDRYLEPMALHWAKARGLRCLDLGARFAPRVGYETVDKRDADVVCDLEVEWPFADSSVGVLRATDIFEHLHDNMRTMRECYRVLAPGGYLLAQVPSTDGRGAWQDPTHVSFWNENSWLYYCHRNWAQYIDTPVRFQAIRRRTTKVNAIGVCWTVAHLVSLKDGYAPPGAIEI